MLCHILQGFRYFYVKTNIVNNQNFKKLTKTDKSMWSFSEIHVIECLLPLILSNNSLTWLARRVKLYHYFTYHIIMFVKWCGLQSAEANIVSYIARFWYFCCYLILIFIYSLSEDNRCLRNSERFWESKGLTEEQEEEWIWWVRYLIEHHHHHVKERDFVTNGVGVFQQKEEKLYSITKIGGRFS